MRNLEYKINNGTQLECEKDMCFLDGFYAREKKIPDFNNICGYVTADLLNKYKINMQNLRENYQKYRVKLHYKLHNQD